MNFVKKNFSTIILVIMFVLGLSLLLYPTISDLYNSYHSTHVISNYGNEVSRLSRDDYDQMLQEAIQYNKDLSSDPYRWYLTDQEKEKYNSLLDINDNGLMGYINIPVINVTYPIYHGTSEVVLQTGIGHIEGSSLPVGGESTHSIISGHRGLPSARLFTDIDQLAEGDLFTITTLNEILTYEVDQIRIVLPQELTSLEIEEGKDYCTLVTCTPYGINTHRLLVRGSRIATLDDARVGFDALLIDEEVVALFIGSSVLLTMFISFMLFYKKK